MKKNNNWILLFCKNVNVTALILVIIFADLIIAILVSQAGYAYYKGSVPDQYVGFIGVVLAFFAGFIGIAVIFRREAPGFLPSRPIKGKLAIFYGLTVLFLSWALA